MLSPIHAHLPTLILIHTLTPKHLRLPLFPVPGSNYSLMWKKKSAAKRNQLAKTHPLKPFHRTDAGFGALWGTFAWGPQGPQPTLSLPELH